LKLKGFAKTAKADIVFGNRSRHNHIRYNHKGHKEHKGDLARLF
jgi:hypothetical protein